MLRPSDKDFLSRCLEKNVMVLQAADTFRRLERRGLVKAEERDTGLRQPVLCVALTKEARRLLIAL